MPLFVETGIQKRIQGGGVETAGNHDVRVERFQVVKNIRVVMHDLTRFAKKSFFKKDVGEIERTVIPGRAGISFRAEDRGELIVAAPTQPAKCWHPIRRRHVA